MTFLGPNCLGFANLRDRTLITFSTVIERTRLGDVAVVCQSGGLGLGSLAFLGTQAGFGFSHLISTGNTSGVSYVDILRFLFEDNSTAVCLLMVESQVAVAQALAALDGRKPPKPVVLLKIGRGKASAEAAKSHTGAVAGDHRLIRDCAEQMGVVVADDIDEAFDCLRLLRGGFSGDMAGGLAAASSSGGMVTLFADACDAAGIELPRLSDATTGSLRRLLPELPTAFANPLDLGLAGREDRQRFIAALDVVLSDESIRGLVPILAASADYSEIVEQILDFARVSPKPVALLIVGGSYDQRSQELLAATEIPVLRSPHRLGRAIQALRRAHEGRALTVPVKRGAGEVSAALTMGPTESESLGFLAANGIPVADWRVAVTHSEAVAVADTLGYPLVLKVDSAQSHISDSGAVSGELRHRDELIAMLQVPVFRDAGSVIVMRFLRGVEFFASVFLDPAFGLLLAIGTGGRLLEEVGDFRFLMLPATMEQIAARFAETIAGRVLRHGVRGAVGFEAAVETLHAVALLGERGIGVVKAMELNPVIAGTHGAAAVDARIELEKQ